MTSHKPYRRMNEEERDTLVILYTRGRSLRAIGKFLGRSASSLSREIRRNTTATGYRPHQAQTQSAARQRASHNRARLKDPALRRKVERMLKWGWSPEIIAGWLRRQAGRTVVGHEAIYQWIYRERRDLSVCLARSRRKRHRRLTRPWRRVRLAGRVPVSQRPWAAHQREEVGHWESDLMVGGGRGALQVTTERMTRYSRLSRIPNKTARAAYQGLRQALGSLPAPARKSLTYDNGAENALHQEVNQALGTRSYFCAPYHSWEKGTVENTNGLIRRFWPKKTCFDSLTQEDIERLERWLNSRPRKCLNFKTPAESFHAACCTGRQNSASICYKQFTSS